MDSWKQSPQWEELFQTVIIKAKECPAIALCFNDIITPEKVCDAAGNHVFDDYFYFWGISENEGHQIRAVFQRYSPRYDKNFKEYIQNLIDSSMELKYKKMREANRTNKE